MMFCAAVERVPATAALAPAPAVAGATDPAGTDPDGLTLGSCSAEPPARSVRPAKKPPMNTTRTTATAAAAAAKAFCLAQARFDLFGSPFANGCGAPAPAHEPADGGAGGWPLTTGPFPYGPLPY